jgi:hypothetical protein
MLHLHLPVSRERALAIRDDIAREHGAWLFGRASHAALPESSVVELYVGDNLLTMNDETVRAVLSRFSAALAQYATITQ